MSLLRRGIPFLLALLLPAAVHAAPGAPRPADPMDRFAAMDASHDGRVDEPEFFKAHPSLSKNAFNTIDRNHSGDIDGEEWKAFSAGHGGAMAPAMDGGMEAMMRSMRGLGGPRPAAGDASGKPLVMPPAGSTPAHTGQGMRPLVMPPAGSTPDSGAATKARGTERPLVMPPAGEARRP